MRRLLRIAVFAAGLFAASAGVGRAQSTAIVDYDADEAFSVPVGDSTATAMVGNVIMHHNGAIVTCDSAVLYNDHFMELFDNVIVNRDSTYVYGDRADFNGVTNIAKVYAPIVKTVNGDMTMYSYDMEFNTLTNIGRYTRGGTITQKDNRMESRRAIYHADERQVYFVGEVAMRNEEYILQTDSMGYNFDTEVTDFYRPARIWNSDGDFLSADRGSYDRATDTYAFTKNSYVLTADDREVFSDSLTYVKSAALAYLFRDIQMHDPAQGSYLFGDYGAYFEADQQAVMTENPSAIGYETDVAQPDSAWLRGDTISLYTLPREERFTGEVAARLRLPDRAELDSVRRGLRELYPTAPADTLAADSTSRWDHLYGEGADSTLLQYGMLGTPADSLPPPDSVWQAVDSLPPPPADSLWQGVDSPGFTRELQAPDSSFMKEAVPLPPDSLIAEEIRPPLPNSLAAAPPDSLIAEETMPSPDALTTEEAEPPAPRTRRELRRERRLEERRQQMRQLAIDQGLIQPPDTTAAAPADSLAPPVDSLAVPEVAVPADSVRRDSLQRVILARRNVKIYRADLQAVADSLVAFSADSTAYLYLDPVLWNDTNQITADSMHIRSRNEQIERADFVGTPIMAQWVTDSLFNQVTGDRIEAFFRDNEIRRMDVLQNAKSYYYMREDDKPDEIGGFIDLKARDIVFVFGDSMRLTDIRAYVSPVSSMFPMTKIPATQPQRFPHFEWLPHRRPTSPAEVSDRVIRPSRREPSRSIPYPPFRITERMEADKKRFIENGVWRERSETLSIDPAYFLNLTR